VTGCYEHIYKVSFSVMDGEFSGLLVYDSIIKREIIRGAFGCVTSIDPGRLFHILPKVDFIMCSTLEQLASRVR
jgi:hypothetical protein